MPKHTIQLNEEEIRIINVIKAVMDLKSIDKAVSFIIADYAKNKDYAGFIEAMRKSNRNEGGK